jgi:hypothetical protein
LIRHGILRTCFTKVKEYYYRRSDVRLKNLEPEPRYTTDGTAKAGVNYVGITAGDSAHGGAVTFAQGSAFATVTIYVIAGSLPVTPATIRAFFTVHLSDPLSPDVSLASGTGTITAQTAVSTLGRLQSGRRQAPLPHSLEHELRPLSN